MKYNVGVRVTPGTVTIFSKDFKIANYKFASVSSKQPSVDSCWATDVAEGYMHSQIRSQVNVDGEQKCSNNVWFNFRVPRLPRTSNVKDCSLRCYCCSSDQ